MPGGASGRSRSFLHCSSFKIIIRISAWKFSLTLLVNIPLADGDSTTLRSMHTQILHQLPPSKDTESETSAVAWSYDWLRFSQQWGFFHTFFLDVSSVTPLYQGKCYFKVAAPASFLENLFKFAVGVCCRWGPNNCKNNCKKTKLAIQLWDQPE